jgi:hypothetical protein
MVRLSKRLTPLLALAAVLATGSVRAASPREELLRLVPEDVGFCLLVEDLRGHAGPFLRSPFFAQLRASPLGERISPESPEMRKLAEVDQFLQQHLHIRFAQLRDDILGDAVVFAYRLGPPGKTEQDQGLFLLHARDARLLDQVLSCLDDVQKQSGELKELEIREHNGVRYRRRVGAKETTYLYLRGPVLVLSWQESMLQRVIDRDRTAEKDDSPVARQFRRLGGERRLARLWINPRAFEPELRQKADAARGPEAVVLKTLERYWHALDTVGLSLGLRDEFELTLTVRVRAADLPAGARRFFAEAARPSEMWTRFPDQALLTVAGRLDVAALLEMLQDFLDADARRALRAMLDQALGAGLTEQVLRDMVPNVGPDIGLCVLAPPGKDPNWFPHVIGAVRVRPGDGAIPADLALVGALNTFAMLAVLDHNRKFPEPMRLRAVTQDGVEVKYLLCDRFPTGFEPSFALKDGHLVLGSSPEAIRRFQATGSTAPPATPAGEVPLVRFNVRELCRYLSERRELIAAHVATKNHTSREEAVRQIDRLLGLLGLIDRVEITQLPQEGQAILTLRVKTSEPLR